MPDREKKFTPGPWEAVEDNQEAGEIKLFYFAVKSKLGNILRLSGSQENKANTNLIAAAPELLEALEKILTHYRSYHHMDSRRMEEAAVAIKKAYGETK